MPISRENTTIIGGVRCLGSQRADFEAWCDDKYGSGNWQYGFLVKVAGSEEPVLLTTQDMHNVFVLSYLAAFQDTPELLYELGRVASDVYEFDPENDLASGIDFTVQESDRTHFIDIAIRYAMAQLGIPFSDAASVVNVNKGGDVIPGTDEEWFVYLSPASLPVPENLGVFLPDEEQPLIQGLADCPKGWLDHDGPLSPEDLYQLSRVLVAVSE